MPEGYFRGQADKECGFTLAETLITLVIIGVVTALTVPNLIVKYQKEQTVSRLKKVYSSLSQAVDKSISENGPISSWPTPVLAAGETADKISYVDKYIFSYLRVAEKCYESIYAANNCRMVQKKQLITTVARANCVDSSSTTGNSFRRWNSNLYGIS